MEDCGVLDQSNPVHMFCFEKSSCHLSSSCFILSRERHILQTGIFFIFRSALDFSKVAFSRGNWEIGIYGNFYISRRKRLWLIGKSVL